MASAHRTYKEECSFIERMDENSFLIKKGFVPNMKVGSILVEFAFIGEKMFGTFPCVTNYLTSSILS